MLWLIGKIFKIILILCIIVLITMAAVILFVNPSNFKSEIKDFAHSFTGYDLEINGSIQWTFKPELAILLEDISLPNPADPKNPILQAKQANVYIDAYSLMSGDLVVNKLEIKNLNATIERKASSKDADTPKSTNSEEPLRKLVVKELNLQNANITLKDAQLAQNWSLANAKIVAKNLMLNPLTKLDPVTIKGDLTNLDNQFTFNVDTVVDTDIDKHSMNFKPFTALWNDAKLNGTVAVTQFSTNPIINGSMALDSLDAAALIIKQNPEAVNDQASLIQNIQGSFDYNYSLEDKTLALSKLELQMDDGTLKGEIKLVLTGPNKISTNLKLNKVDLLAIANLLGTIAPSLVPQNDELIPFAVIKTASYEGDITGTSIKLGPEFLMDHITIAMTTENSVLSLSPITLSAYKGNHNCGLVIDLSKDTPTFKISEQASEVVLEPVFKLLNLTNTVMGTADAKIAIQATGNDVSSLKQSATGGINLNIKDGSLFGVDLDALLLYTVNNIVQAMQQVTPGSTTNPIDVLKPKFAAWMSSQKNNPTTAFASLEFRADLKQGTGNSSITMTSPSIDLKSNGGFNLIDNKVNYSAQITNKTVMGNANDELAASLKQMSVPMSITGTMDQLVFNPDLLSYASATTKKIQDAANKKAIAKMVEGAGPNIQTSKRAEDLFADGLRAAGKL